MFNIDRKRPCYGARPGAVEPVLFFDQRARVTTRILKFATRDWRTKLGDAARNHENCASETALRLANFRQCRDNFCQLDMGHRDRTGWLGM